MLRLLRLPPPSTATPPASPWQSRRLMRPKPAATTCRRRFVVGVGGGGASPLLPHSTAGGRRLMVPHRCFSSAALTARGAITGDGSPAGRGLLVPRHRYYSSSVIAGHHRPGEDAGCRRRDNWSWRHDHHQQRRDHHTSRPRPPLSSSPSMSMMGSGGGLRSLSVTPLPAVASEEEEDGDEPYGDGDGIPDPDDEDDESSFQIVTTRGNYAVGTPLERIVEAWADDDDDGGVASPENALLWLERAEGGGNGRMMMVRGRTPRFGGTGTGTTADDDVPDSSAGAGTDRRGRGGRRGGGRRAPTPKDGGGTAAHRRVRPGRRRRRDGGDGRRGGRVDDDPPPLRPSTMSVGDRGGSTWASSTTSAPAASARVYDATLGALSRHASDLRRTAWWGHQQRRRRGRGGRSSGAGEWAEGGDPIESSRRRAEAGAASVLRRRIISSSNSSPDDDADADADADAGGSVVDVASWNAYIRCLADAHRPANTDEGQLPETGDDDQVPSRDGHDVGNGGDLSWFSFSSSSSNLLGVVKGGGRLAAAERAEDVLVGMLVHHGFHWADREDKGGAGDTSVVDAGNNSGEKDENEDDGADADADADTDTDTGTAASSSSTTTTPPRQRYPLPNADTFHAVMEQWAHHPADPALGARRTGDWHAAMVRYMRELGERDGSADTSAEPTGEVVAGVVAGDARDEGGGGADVVLMESLRLMSIAAANNSSQKPFDFETSKRRIEEVFSTAVGSSTSFSTGGGGGHGDGGATSWAPIDAYNAPLRRSGPPPTAVTRVGGLRGRNTTQPWDVPWEGGVGGGGGGPRLLAEAESMERYLRWMEEEGGGGDRYDDDVLPSSHSPPSPSLPPPRPPPPPNVETYESAIQAWVRVGTPHGLLRAEEVAHDLLAAHVRRRRRHRDGDVDGGGRTSEPPRASAWCEPRLSTYHPIIGAWTYSDFEYGPLYVEDWIRRLVDLSGGGVGVGDDRRAVASAVAAAVAADLDGEPAMALATVRPDGRVVSSAIIAWWRRAVDGGKKKRPSPREGDDLESSSAGRDGVALVVAVNGASSTREDEVIPDDRRAASGEGDDATVECDLNVENDATSQPAVAPASVALPGDGGTIGFSPTFAAERCMEWLDKICSLERDGYFGDDGVHYSAFAFAIDAVGFCLHHIPPEEKLEYSIWGVESIIRALSSLDSLLFEEARAGDGGIGRDDHHPKVGGRRYRHHLIEKVPLVYTLAMSHARRFRSVPIPSGSTTSFDERFVPVIETMLRNVEEMYPMVVGRMRPYQRGPGGEDTDYDRGTTDSLRHADHCFDTTSLGGDTNDLDSFRELSCLSADNDGYRYDCPLRHGGGGGRMTTSSPDRHHHPYHDLYLEILRYTKNLSRAGNRGDAVRIVMSILDGLVQSSSSSSSSADFSASSLSGRNVDATEIYREMISCIGNVVGNDVEKRDILERIYGVASRSEPTDREQCLREIEKAMKYTARGDELVERLRSSPSS